MDEALYMYFLKYAKILNKIDDASENEELRFTSEEREAYIRVLEAAEKNEIIRELLGNVKNCNSKNRLRVVEDFFKKKVEPKKEENGSKTFESDAAKANTFSSAASIVSNSNDLSSMFEDSDNNQLAESKKQPDTKKARVLSLFSEQTNSTNNNALDKAGFVNNIIFVLLMASVFVALIIEIIYFM